MQNAMRYSYTFISLLTVLNSLVVSPAMAESRYVVGMSTRGDKALVPIEAQRVKVESLIVGGVACTRLDIDFYNPNDRALEGIFSIPLAPGWRLGKFELDLDGKLRAAVPVSKSTGRKAFNAVKRRGVDPALVEQTADNLFTARVYPFAARGHRRVVITLDHPLRREHEEDVYELPYSFEKPLKELSVEIRVVERSVEDARVEGLNGLSHVSGRNESVWRYEKRDAMLQGAVKIYLPRSIRKQLIVAKDSVGVVYASYVKPVVGGRRGPLPKRVSVVWDASGSAGRGAIKKSKELLAAYLAEIGTCEVELVSFGIEASVPQRFNIVKGNTDLLKRALDELQYDGATDINSVGWDKLRGDVVLLFCDGVQTVPSAVLPIKVGAKLQAVNSSSVCNAHWLERVALSHGGQFVDLRKLSIESATRVLTSETQRVNWWQPKEDKRYVCPVSVESDGVWLFGTSQAVPESVDVALSVGQEKEKVYTVSNGEAGVVWNDSELAAMLRRMYANQEVLRLRGLGKDGEAERLAQEYGLTTEKTSLIVLESVEDYARYGITPPLELQGEYVALVSKNRKNSDSVAKERLESLVKRSDEQSRWWRGEVEVPKEVSLEMPVRALGLEGRVRGVASNFNATGDSYYEEAVVESSPSASAGLKKETEDGERVGSISIAAWDSESPYLKVLEYAEKDKQKSTYYKLKREYGMVPSFYLDAGNFFEQAGDRAFAYRVLSNLLEMELGSTELLRALAQSLVGIGMLNEAEAVYRKIADDSAYEPQSFRDLALVCEAQGKLQEAVDMLYKVATGDWERRFDGIDLICMNELNALLMRNGTANLDLSAIDKRLIKREPVDVRVVLTWSNDDSDVDLHVGLPDGEECYFGYRMTRALGKLSNDVTQGYGPEEFMQRRGDRGEYLVRARLYADHSQSSIVPKYVKAVCFLHYGTREEERKELIFRIKDEKQTVTIGTIRFE